MQGIVSSILLLIGILFAKVLTEKTKEQRTQRGERGFLSESVDW